MTSERTTSIVKRRLTDYAHGGGCGCKIAPGVLTGLLSSMQPPVAGFAPQLMVGIETSDDAAVYRLNDSQALVSTTDFFMPIVDDGFDFGRIAATNAISDIYAMGARPIFALAIVGMPVDKLDAATIGSILAGGQSVCHAAGIPIAGGHTIDSVEPIYGLAVSGLVDPAKLRRNSTAQAGDLLVLGKPLGVGVLSSAFKKQVLDEAGYRRLVDLTTQLNTPGPLLADLPEVHAMTDVTGFGLLGHANEMARGAGLVARLDCARLPVIDGVVELMGAGCVTGASGRNWAGYGSAVALGSGLPAHARALLTDPQTSGGLLVACAPSTVEAVLAIFAEQGFAQAGVIGQFSGAGRDAVTVTVD
ncbi:selenide, water dikinase SelD [soil metagenome]